MSRRLAVIAVSILSLVGVAALSIAQDAKAWERQGTRAGDEIIGPDGGKMVWVPPGEFVMGSPAGEGYNDEHPAHRVRITRGFWLGKGTVTNAQYRRFCAVTRRSFPWGRSGGNLGQEHPVICVNWDDVVAYCLHYGLRLPTEAEWEYAARGPESRVYPWGNEWDAKKCCNSGKSGPAGLGTLPVGSFPQGASWCGALDMAGDVWQWCKGWWSDKYYASSPVDDPRGPASGQVRVVRGGDSCSDADHCRSAFRCSHEPGHRSECCDFGGAGFRVVVVPAPLASATSPSTGPSPQAVAQLAAANARFAFKLFAELLEEQPHDNVFVSPTSISLALAMAYNGAGGTTRQGMAQALEIQGMSVREVNEANLALAQDLTAPHEGLKLTIANSLWADKGTTFSPAFLKVNQDFYGARVTSLDFTNPDAAGIMNHWVSQQTEGKIPEIVSADDLGSGMPILINAVYFLAPWTSVFDPDDTTDQPFTLLDGSQQTVRMMMKEDKYPYFEDEGFQAISLPYGDEQRFSMCIFLPKETSTLAEFCKSLNAEQWAAWMAAFDGHQGTIMLPRFKAEYEVELRGPLEALGMGEAFGSRADFAGMLQPARSWFRIGGVKHKTYVEVNEKGTEAAAVTEIGGPTAANGGRRPPEPFYMVVDHPFFCAIRDNETDTILFMGVIVNPGEVAR